MRNPQFSFGNFRAVFAPRKPRNPLAKIGLGLLGLVVLSVLLFFGLFVGAAMLVTGLVMKLIAPRRAMRNPAPLDPTVVDAQYTVVSRTAIDAPR
jgi:hypothetical protein